jgi:hypothetical protein
MSHPLTAAANAGLFMVSAVLSSCAGYGPIADPARRISHTPPGAAHNAIALAVAGAALLAYSRRNDH